MKIDQTEDVRATLERMADRKQQRRLVAAMISLLTDPEPETSTLISDSDYRRIDVDVYTIIYRYWKDKALVQVVLVAQKMSNTEPRTNN